MIKKYTKKNGQTAYMVSMYLGKDPITGKERRTTRRGFTSKREAKLAEAKLQTQINENGLTRNDITTFNELYELWLQQYKPTVKESSYKQVKSIFRNNILPLLGDKKLKDFTIPFCQNIVNKWSENFTNYRAYRNYVSAILNYAIRLQLLTNNPMMMTSLPRKKSKNVDDGILYYGKDELQAFFKLIEHDTMYYTIFRILAFTGIRKGELYALTWEDIDLGQMTLKINKTTYRSENGEILASDPKSNSSNRVISLDTKTINILKKWRKVQRSEWFKLGFNTSSKDQLVFSNTLRNDYLQPAFLNDRLARLCKKHKFKQITIHGFRHTHCSLLFESGATIQQVQERLGHNKIETTMSIYAHVTQNQKDQLAEKFSKYIDF
ncbi:site-specific integrase [Staphylococcus xylosus]